MSMDPWEAEQEEQYLQLYAEHRVQAIAEFQQERFTAYYLLNREIAAPAMDFFDRAVAIREESAEAALVFASAAIEVTIKAVLLRPLISGMVHAEAVAPLVANELLKPSGFDRSKDLLFAVLLKAARVDLNSHRRAVSSKPLWEELTENTKVRNSVVHRCERVNDGDVSRAVGIAEELLVNLFPAIVGELGLHVHDRFRICDEFHRPERIEASRRGA